MIIKSDVMVACLLGAGAAYVEEQLKNLKGAQAHSTIILNEINYSLIL